MIFSRQWWRWLSFPRGSSSSGPFSLKLQSPSIKSTDFSLNSQFLAPPPVTARNDMADQTPGKIEIGEIVELFTKFTALVGKFQDAQGSIAPGTNKVVAALTVAKAVFPSFADIVIQAIEDAKD